MRLEPNGDTLISTFTWDDIEALKEGKEIAERYNGEHKLNVSCSSESLMCENWYETARMRKPSRFDTFLNDFFIELSVFDIRHSLVRHLRLDAPKNPYFKTIVFNFPTW